MSRQVFLIVLGDPSDRAAFNRALRATPHRLIFALDGEDGFDRFGEVKPDVLITHVHAPRLDAAILCALVRKEPAGKNVPILLYGPELNDAITAASKVGALGATGAFAEPFDSSTLSRALAPFVDVSGMVDEAVDLDISIDEGSFEEDLAGFDPALVSAAMADSQAEVDVPSDVADHDVHGDAEVTAPGVPIARIEAQGAAEPMPLTRIPVNMAFTPPPMIEPADGFEEPELPTHARVAMQNESPAEDTGQRRIAEIPIERSHSGAWPVKPPATAPVAAGLDESQLGRRLARRVRQTHQLLDELDYYQLLSIEPTATDQDVRDAYFEVSLEFHPDRFFLMKSGDLKEKIYAIYRRVTEAYAVLGHPARRDQYDLALAERHEKRAPRGQRSMPTTASSIDPIADPLTIEAESEAALIYVRLAEKAFSGGDHDGARMFLGFARVYEPNNGSIAAALGRVVAERPRPVDANHPAP